MLEVSRNKPQVKMKNIVQLAILLSLSGLSSPFPNGAPEKACEGLVPSPSGHKASPSNKTSPYVFTSQVIEETLMLKVIRMGVDFSKF